MTLSLDLGYGFGGIFGLYFSNNDWGFLELLLLKGKGVNINSGSTGRLKRY